MFLLFPLNNAQASIINAIDASLASVQAAVSLANTGDTVQVPAGTATWTSSLVVNKDIVIAGAGIGQTVITDGGTTYAINLITWNTSTTFPQRLTGITFQGQSGQQNPFNSGEIVISGSTLDLRVDDCKFLNIAQPAFLMNAPGGVFDHNQYFNNNFANFVECWGYGYGGQYADALGDGSWTVPMQWGTTNAVYIESNVIVYNGGSGYPGPGVDDSFAGARIVFRYNTVTNMFFQDHGTESSQMRSGRASEVYMNTFVNVVGESWPMGVPVELRGGTALIWSNTFVGYGSVASYEDFRSTGYFYPFGSANGLNSWDLNNTNNPILIASGTHTGTNGSPFLEDANANWTVNKFVGGYEVLNISSGGTNTGSYSLIASNGVHDIYTLLDHAGVPTLWNNGQSYQVYLSYRHLDQVGSGSGDPVIISNNMPYDALTGKATWTHEAIEPVYQWGNTLNGQANPSVGPSTGYFGNGQGGYSIIQLGRDYFDNVQKPGYTPLVFPHPLVSGAPAPTTYALTVVNGTGSGSYTSNSIVTISAIVPTGVVFANWSGLHIANTNSATTTVTMPAANLTVTANLISVPTYTLTVVNGTGGGTYVPNSVVPISANTISGESFVHWVGSNIANTNSATTTVTTTSANQTVTAVYVSVPTYMLTVSNGSGSGTYTSGSVVNISANTISGESFQYWVGSNIASTNSANTTVTMPGSNLTIAAVYAATTNLTTLGVITAADPSLPSVQAAVNSASAGETVQVPAGSATWTGTLIINNDIQLVGAGIGQTIITDNESRSGGSDRLINWTTVANGLPRLSGFTFQGVTNTAAAYDGALAFQGNCASLRIDHCQFNYLYNANMQIVEPVFGVVDHCQFSQTWSDGIQVYGTGIGGGNYGDGSWATPVQWGSTNFVCVENCSFYYPGYPYPYMSDGLAGARIVFRYNSVTNGGLQDFSTGTTARDRGGRAFEVYGNTFIQNAAGKNAGAAILMRSGTAVVFSNQLSGYSSTITLGNDRATSDLEPWGSANGKNSWESNSPSVLVSGIATASGTGSLVDSTKNWTINQWVGGYELQDLTQGGTNTGTFSLIYSNSATTIYCLSSLNGTQLAVNSGDSYQICQCYRQLDQVGLGSGDLVQDSAQGNGSPVNSLTGQPSWPHEVSEPLYQWGNTLNGANYAIGPNNLGQAYNVIRQNLDYFDNAAKPGYTPLVYPHPLVSATVPVTTYALTVINGTGSGNYTANSVVAISAVAPAGEVFSHWSGLYLAATNSATTSVLMPGASLTVTANFAPMPPTGLRVVSVSGH